MVECSDNIYDGDDLNRAESALARSARIKLDLPEDRNTEICHMIQCHVTQ